ncbi:MAG: hypothetical protein RIM72_06185 [Alphaproteobacteria bacterium]
MRKAVLTFVVLCIVGIGGTYAAIAVIDPFDHLALSPDLPRKRVSSNERWTFPGMVRNTAYDGAVFGTSTSILLHPDDLSAAFGGRIANLSMASSTAWEQRRMIDYFLAHNPDPDIMLVGLDVVWCNLSSVDDRETFRGFPDWMYDDDPINDYAHLLNARMLVNAGRQVLAMMGRAAPHFGPDGYFRFVPPDDQYSLQKALTKIYGNRQVPPKPSDDTVAHWRNTLPVEPADNPAIDALADTLRAADSSKIVLFFVPYHYSMTAKPETWRRYESCKQAVSKAFAGRDNAIVVDFMQFTPITLNDENYWDGLHYRVPVTGRLVSALKDAVAGKPFPPEIGSVR